MKRVAEMTDQPVVGQFYIVPQLGEMPVVPTIHTDEGLDRRHAHIDMRFVRSDGRGGYEAEQFNGDLVRIKLNNADFLPHEADLSKGKIAGVAGCSDGEQLSEGKYQCLQRQRWNAKVPFPGTTEEPVKPVCRAGRLYCPHRGADVTALKPDRRGFARCPLHGQLLDLRGSK